MPFLLNVHFRIESSAWHMEICADAAIYECGVLQQLTHIQWLQT